MKFIIRCIYIGSALGIAALFILLWIKDVPGPFANMEVAKDQFKSTCEAAGGLAVPYGYHGLKITCIDKSAVIELERP